MEITGMWIDECAESERLQIQKWALEQIDIHYAQSALWLFKRLPSAAITALAYLEKKKMGLHNDSYSPYATCNS